MCKVNLESVSIFDIVEELKRRDLLTNGWSNTEILKNMDEDDSLKFILTKGKPEFDLECGRCRQMHHPSKFIFYASRVERNGYLQRSNVICETCRTHSDSQRKRVLDSADIPDKPKKGDECPKCKRKWNGRWHRHHVGEEFIEWLCLHCNTHLNDQRDQVNIQE